MNNHRSDFASAVGYGLTAMVITVVLGFVGGMALYSAYSEHNDMAGLGPPQLGLFYAPFIGVVVGVMRYGWLRGRLR